MTFVVEEVPPSIRAAERDGGGGYRRDRPRHAGHPGAGRGPANDRRLSRGTHAKGICVRAQFEVLDLRRTLGDPALAARLARSIFARPGIYPATVRFANADGGHRPDKVRDVRALSFSVDVPAGRCPDRGVSPEVSRVDFSMNTATTFPINDAHAFAVAVRVLSATGMRGKFRALRSLTWSEKGSLLQTMWLGESSSEGHRRLAVPAAPLLEHGAVSLRGAGRGEVLGDPCRQSRPSTAAGAESPPGRARAARERRRADERVHVRAAASRPGEDDPWRSQP